MGGSVLNIPKIDFTKTGAFCENGLLDFKLLLDFDVTISTLYINLNFSRCSRKFLILLDLVFDFLSVV